VVGGIGNFAPLISPEDGGGVLQLPQPFPEMVPPAQPTASRRSKPVTMFGRGHCHNASQPQRDLWFTHCEQLVQNEKLKTSAMEMLRSIA